jgi:predicted aspartyl protease
MMMNQHTPRTFRLPIAGTLLAVSFLAGCASDLPTQTAMVQLGGGQPPSQTFTVAREAPCNAQPAGEMALHMKGQQAFVTLAVNNTSLNLLLDTGDFVTSLAPSAVQRLALPASSEPSLQMTGIGGAYAAPVVEASDVQYLSQHVANMSFPVLPESEFQPEEHVDGLFGANFLSAYGVEMDFPGHKLRFFKPGDACGNNAPSWTARATRLQATDAGHQLLLIPVRINGVELNALIDTGSEDTSITKDAAESLGITAAKMSGDMQITEQGLGESTERVHKFDSISIGNATFDRPMLAVDDEPSPIQQNVQVATAAAMPVPHRGVDVILGANFLFKKRIFIDYAQGAVFIE